MIFRLQLEAQEAWRLLPRQQGPQAGLFRHEDRPCDVRPAQTSIGDRIRRRARLASPDDAAYPECNVLIPLSHHAEESKVPAGKSVPVRIIQ
jgi:hypothetical protein